MERQGCLLKGAHYGQYLEGLVVLLGSPERPLHEDVIVSISFSGDPRILEIERLGISQEKTACTL